MYRLIVAIFIFTASQSQAQDQLANSQFDALTYQQYVAGNWEALKRTGNTALKQGIEFDYLRNRLGSAHYQLGNYRKAAHHFRKSLKKNKADEFARESLYWSYIFGEQYSNAAAIASQFDQETRINLKIKTTRLASMIYTEGGVKLPTKTDSIEMMKYAHAGISHLLGKGVSLFHGYSFVNQTRYWGELTQHQYFATFNISYKNAWRFAPALHIIWLNAAPFFEQTAAIGSFHVLKSCGNFDFALGFSLSDFMNERQIQESFSATYFPLGNPKLSLASTFFLQEENKTNQLAVSSTVAFKPWKKLKVSITHYQGNARNLSEQNGYLVNNSLDLTNYKVSLLTDFYLHKAISLYLFYQFENNTENFQNFEYQYHTTILGLKIVP